MIDQYKKDEVYEQLLSSLHTLREYDKQNDNEIDTRLGSLECQNNIIINSLESMLTQLKGV